MTIDINCDLGESFGRYSLGNDFEILQYISSCNIACGFHAGDPKIIIDTIKEADKQSVKIGAHPSYPDLQGFGRRRMIIPQKELVPIIQYQIAVLGRLADIHANDLHHVKPHGALYNHAYADKDVACGILKAFEPWKDIAFLYAQYGSQLQRLAHEEGAKIKVEGFADRRYDIDLNLMSRTHPKALHESIDDIIVQVIDMVKHNKVQTKKGEQPIEVDTICVHGDHPKAIKIVKELTSTLIQEGVTIE